MIKYRKILWKGQKGLFLKELKSKKSKSKTKKIKKKMIFLVST